MTANDWVDGAQIVSALAAIAALFWNASAMRQQARATDAETLKSWLVQLREIDETIASSVSDPTFLRQFNSLLNVLEVMATSLNARLLHKTTSRILTAHLIESVAIIEATPGAADLVSQAVDAPETFIELRTFIERNRCKVNQARERRKSTQLGQNQN